MSKVKMRPRSLEKANSYLSAPDAFEAMKSLGVAVLDIAGQRRVLTGGMSRDARQVIRILGIKNTQPPETHNVEQNEVGKCLVMANQKQAH